MCYTLVIYNSILVFSFLSSYGATYAKRAYQRAIFRFLCFLFLFFPAAVRYGIGTDYFAYVDIFETIDFKTTTLEPGYVFLNVLISFCGLDVQWVFVITSCIIYGLICFGLPKKNYVYYITLFVLLFYLRSYNIVRQAIAVSFLLLACVYYAKNKKLFYLGICIASVFHYSAILVFLVGIIKQVKIYKFQPVYFLMLLYVLHKVNFVDVIFSSNCFLNTAYANYANSIFNVTTSLGSGIGVCIRTVIPLIVIFRGYELAKKNEAYKMYIWLAYIYLLVYFFALHVLIFNRLVDLFIFVPVLCFPIIRSEYGKSRKCFTYFVLLIFVVNFQKVIIDSLSSYGTGNGINPYVSIFNK